MEAQTMVHYRRLYFWKQADHEVNTHYFVCLIFPLQVC